MTDTPTPAKKAAVKKKSGPDWEALARALAEVSGHNQRTLERRFGWPKE
jgi:hypothetical protein